MKRLTEEKNYLTNVFKEHDNLYFVYTGSDGYKCEIYSTQEEVYLKDNYNKINFFENHLTIDMIAIGDTSYEYKKIIGANLGYKEMLEALLLRHLPKLKDYEFIYKKENGYTAKLKNEIADNYLYTHGYINYEMESETFITYKMLPDKSYVSEAVIELFTEDKKVTEIGKISITYDAALPDFLKK